MNRNEKNIHKCFSIRTDLAIEAREMMKETQEDQGIYVDTEETDSYILTRVEIQTEQASQQMGKPKGNYITLEAQALKENDVDSHKEIIQALAKELSTLAKPKANATVLVVGLGNWNITPDALGPKVVSRILVTRHLSQALPENIAKTMRPVAAISPGVMGLTGIETGEIVKGISEKMHPDLILAIDALAARKTSRINATIQLSDTGLAPGAGVGNQRKLLSKETLGIPVIAIGVPTVVDAATLVNDTMDCMLEQMQQQTGQEEAFYAMLRSLEGEEKYHLITQMLTPYAENMFVTPKEVDAVVDRLANIIANAINIALQPEITLEDIAKYQG